ncbi:MAG: long-chain fatty acid--CoA ligase [Jatrophihabitans sp.]|nr:MAG: long-chain fatty acid--CoA ligase [Jatrophihabitans sp.]
MTEPSTLCEAFQATAARYGDRVAIRASDGSLSLTWREYGERVRTLAAGLAGLGVRAGDTVALMLANRPEFHVCDTAVLHMGATPFSVYNTLAPQQIAYLFANAGNRVVICERQFLDRVRAAVAGSTVEHIVCVDAGEPGTLALEEVTARPDPAFDFDASWRAIRSQDVLTIIYTSGTTGPPKGVELTHANMLAELRATDAVTAAGPQDTVVSYLPDAHIANRWGSHYANMFTGVQVVTVADLRSLVTVLPQVRPTLFGGVPQVWYKLKAGLDAALAAEPSIAKRKLAAWAIGVGSEVVRRRSDGRAVPIGMRVRHRVAERLVLSRIRARIGLDRVRVAVSGASAIAPDVLVFVLGIGIPCCELWGMSELTCTATLNRPDAVRIGTVGPPVPGLELSLADDGELLARGPLVMKGYRNDPQRTAEAIDADGWLHTGDIATMDADGYVTIVDRKKELIINAAGKNMSPANIEGTVKAACPLAGSIAAIGNDRPYVVALITLDPDACAAFAAARGLGASSPAELAAEPVVQQAVDAGVRAANEKLSRVEQIKRFTILPATWEPGGEEVTPTMKLRRKPIAAKYAREIEALYA